MYQVSVVPFTEYRSLPQEVRGLFPFTKVIRAHDPEKVWPQTFVVFRSEDSMKSVTFIESDDNKVLPARTHLWPLAYAVHTSLSMISVEVANPNRPWIPISWKVLYREA